MAEYPLRRRERPPLGLYSALGGVGVPRQGEVDPRVSGHYLALPVVRVVAEENIGALWAVCGSGASHIAVLGEWRFAPILHAYQADGVGIDADVYSGVAQQGETQRFVQLFGLSRLCCLAASVGQWV